MMQVIITLDHWKSSDRRVFEHKKSRIHDALRGSTGIINGVTEENKEEIFYMLLFCLCVPQSKAIKAEEAIDIFRKRDYFNNELSELEICEILKGRVRFQSTKARRLVTAHHLFLTSDFWKVLKNYYRDYIQTAEKNRFTSLHAARRYLIQAVDGIGMKLASVTEDTKIYIKRQGNTMVVPICEVLKTDMALSLNRTSNSLEFRSVLNVWDHGFMPTRRVKCESGREITISNDHSLFTLNVGKITEIRGEDIKSGDHLLFVSNLPEGFEHSDILISDIKKYLKGNIKIYREKISCVSHIIKSLRNRYIAKFRRTIPIDFIDQISFDNIEQLHYKTSSYDRYRFKLDEDMCWILGIFVAEGSTNRKGRIEFTIGAHETDLKNKVCEKFVKCFGRKITVRNESHRGVTRLICDNFFIVAFLRYMFDDVFKACEIKKVKHILDLPKTHIRSFIMGYWEGDGTHSCTESYTASSCSFDMILFLRLCLSVLGVNAHITFANPRGNNEKQWFVCFNAPVKELGICHESNQDHFPIGESLHKLHQMSRLPSRKLGHHTELYKEIIRTKCINIPSRSKTYELLLKLGENSADVRNCQLYKTLLELCNNNQIHFTRVISVEDVGLKRVFDIEVEDNQNFVCADSLLLAHNSHFLRNIGMSGLCILDVHVIDGLYKRGVINSKKLGLSKTEYLEIEKKMKEYAESINLSIDELDLLLWSQKTGYVFK